MKRPAVYTAAFLVVLAMLFVPASNAEAQPVQNPTNGHFYEAIAVPAGIDWATAFVAATTSTFQGEAGYLATVTSMSEHDFIVNTFPASVPVPGPFGYRSGPRNLDSGLSEISIVFQAAVPPAPHDFFGQPSARRRMSYVQGKTARG